MIGSLASTPVASPARIGSRPALALVPAANAPGPGPQEPVDGATLTGGSSTAPTSPKMREEVADVNGNDVITYGLETDGTVSKTYPPGKSAPTGATSWSRYLRELFVPRNVSSSVSADYLPTRKWMFVHDIAFNLGKFAAGAATAAALGMSPIWGGAAMATFNLIIDRTCQTTGFLSTFATPQADRNPRPWIVAGETLDTAGTIIQSAASMIPGAVLPVGMAAAVISVFGGGMRGAAQANIDPRQAVADNLGELRAKNGNQAFVASLLGSLGGMTAFSLLTPVLGTLAAPALTAAAATAAVLSMGAMVRRLDFCPVNEKAVRTVVDELEAGRAVPAPERKNVFRSIATLREQDHVVLGREIGGLIGDRARFDELRAMYHGRRYMLDVRDGAPYIVLRADAELNDRFQAVMQAVLVERLMSSEEHAKRLAQDGPEKTNAWLVSESLRKTPASVDPLVADMKAAGWSVDKMRFVDTGLRSKWEDPAPHAA